MSHEIQNFQTHYILTYDNVTYKIIKPSKSYDHFIISSNKHAMWVDKLNMYCIDKNPTKSKLIDKIKKYIDKNKKCIDESNKNIVSSETKEMDYYEMKDYLKSLINTSNSSLMFISTINKSLCKKSEIGNLVINEYLSCSMNSKDKYELINNNIFSWKITTNANNQFKKQIVINIHFNESHYPYYPPIVEITSPIFEHSLANRITNSKMTQLDYWTPTRSVTFIIDRVKAILDKWGLINKSATKIVYHESITQFQQLLSKFASFIDAVNVTDEIDSDFTFPKTNMKNVRHENDMTKTNKPDKGVGYTTKTSKTWNPDEYIKLHNEKTTNIVACMKQMITIIKSVKTDKTDKIPFMQLCEIISESILIPYLIQLYNNSTLLNMLEKEELFTNSIELLLLIITIETSNNMMFIKHNNTSLHNIFVEYRQFLGNALKVDNTNEFLKTMIDAIEIISENYNKKNMDKNKIVGTKNETNVEQQNENIDEQYKSTMKKLKFAYTTNILNTNYNALYRKLYEEQKFDNWKNAFKRLSMEIPSLNSKDQLPIEFGSSIFIRADENNPMIMRALITGPADTPYDSGCFIFDIYAPSKYPAAAPHFWFMNHSGFRFNPNLYNTGKVCLSILGTYSGPPLTTSEKWIGNMSGLLQVLISIQAQIFTDHPYFNEPGYEAEMGTALGNKSTAAYNSTIIKYTMKSTMLDLMLNPTLYPQFEDVIVNHFKLKKNHIKKMLDGWKNKIPQSDMVNFEKIKQQVFDALDKY